jgi:hypothetical protein
MSERRTQDDSGERGGRGRRPDKADRFPPLPDEMPSAPAQGPAAPRRPAPARRAHRPYDPRRNRLYNVVTLVFSLGTILVLAIVLFLWDNYNSPINPLAPPTPPPIFVTATYTPTFTVTPAPTLAPSETYTPSVAPTLTPSLTFTPVVLEAFITPQGTPGTLAPGGSASEGDFPYTLFRGAVSYRTNPDARGGCRWTSIGGTVLDYEGNPVSGYQVRIVGEGVDQTVSTGSSSGFGPGGFELQLGSEASAALFTVQLLDAQGRPASQAYPVNTRADCDFNIAALPFVEVAPSP